MATPTIFIPGIQGTALADINTIDFNLVWDKFDTLLGAAGNRIVGIKFTEKLQEDQEFDEIPTSIIERNHVFRFPYEDLVTSFYSKTCSDIYLFGYDWRKSSVYNAKLLLEYVNYLKRKLKVVTAFNFVTHSMGGLVFSCFLKQLSGNYSVVNRAVITAPPFRGSPYALVHLTVGNGGIRGFLNVNDDSRKTNRTFPAIYELCPYYSGAVAYADGSRELDLTKKADWQDNIYTDIVSLFEKRLAALADYRNTQLFNIASLPEAIQKKIVIVAGIGDKTLTRVKADKNKGGIKNFFNYEKSVEEDGDGTVPAASSTIYKGPILTLAVKKSIWHPSSAISYHALFLKDGRVQNIMARFIRGDDKDHPNDWWQSVGDTVKKL